MKATDVKYIVIHCSDSPNDREVTASDIHTWHMAKGWDGIGYHSVIHRSGQIEYGRPTYWIGSHVKGHNDESIGICLIGKDKFEEFQLNALKSWIDYQLTLFPNAKVVGHYELDSRKPCPNFDVQAWLKAYDSIE